MQLLLSGHGQKFVFPANLRYQSADELGLRWTTLDAQHWPNGDAMFDSMTAVDAPKMAHANMRPLKRKKKDLAKHQLWFLNDDADGCDIVSNKRLTVAPWLCFFH